MLRIVFQLKYCGKPVSETEMLEKTYLTFHKEHRILQELYRKSGYTRFSELIVELILAEKNNELLIRNHNSRPTGAKAFPEANAMEMRYPEKRGNTHRGHPYGGPTHDGPTYGNHTQGGHPYGGRGRRFNRGRGRNYNPQGRKSFKWVRSEQFPKGKEPQGNIPQRREQECFRCGSKGHFAKICRTPPHLCKLYQDSIKGKGKEVNMNELLEGSTYLEASDFARDFDETILKMN